MMAVNNAIYDELADTWWDKKGMLHLLSVLNVARFKYLRNVLSDELHIDPQGKAVLDIGCGGGLLAEEFAAIGCDVVGIDPSAASVATAKEHAAAGGLAIRYEVGSGEKLPFKDGSFEIVYCCDVLEHVADLSQVLAEANRVLKNGGVFLYDTMNRTVPSRFITKLLQDWTSIMPPDTHDWQMFIKPSELSEKMAAVGLANKDTVGIGPTANPIKLGLEFSKVMLGRQTFAEAFLRMRPAATKNKLVMYMGYALKSE